MAEADLPLPRPRKGRRNMRRPTLADVADAAGVSSMTVSRVINRDGRVAIGTREQVEQAVARLGYVPNSAARGLARGRPCRIALIHSNPSASFLSAVLVAALEEATQAGAHLIVERCGRDDSAAELVARLFEHRANAVLLLPPHCEDRILLGALARANMPVVKFGTGSPGPQALSVTIDNEAAAHAMTARLIARGHRRIGFIAGDPSQTASALRLAGFVRGLREAGLAADQNLVANGDYTFRAGMIAADRLLALSSPPTAIFASNDDMAAGVIAATHRRRLAVPAQLAVCGFDDTAIATMVWPELTTIRQPLAEMTRIATRRLVAAVIEREAFGSTLPVLEQLPFELVERDSDAATIHRH